MLCPQLVSELDYAACSVYGQATAVQLFCIVNDSNKWTTTCWSHCLIDPKNTHITRQLQFGRSGPGLPHTALLPHAPLLPPRNAPCTPPITRTITRLAHGQHPNLLNLLHMPHMPSHCMQTLWGPDLGPRPGPPLGRRQHEGVLSRLGYACV